MDEGGVNYASPRNVTQVRQTVYCVPIPGETPWVRATRAASATAAGLSGPAVQQAATTRKPKRGMDTSDDEDEDEAAAAGGGGAAATGGAAAAAIAPTTPTTTASAAPDKKTKLGSTASGAGGAAQINMNFPLPGETGPAVMVKLYDEPTSPKLNQMMEYVGVYEIGQDVASDADFSDDRFGLEEEIRAHNPPASLIPRLHCIASRPVTEANPLVPNPMPAALVTQVHAAAKTLKERLRQWLTTVTGAGPMVVEFVILHLLARVRQRMDGNTMVLGKMSINIFGFKAENSKAMSNLMMVMESLLVKMHVLPMTLETLNMRRFVPQKDPNSNRLWTGVLQLTPETELVLNETAMLPGQLNPTGVKNLTSLGHLLRDQAVTYEFPFAPLPPFETDIPILVLSEGKSLLPADVHVPFVAAATPAALAVPPALLSELRVYLTVVRKIEVDIEQPVAEVIEKDFVAMRQANPKDVQAETLHNLLVLSRLMSMSKGEAKLSAESWRETCQLEDTRMKAMPPVPAGAAAAAAAAAGGGGGAAAATTTTTTTLQTAAAAAPVAATPAVKAM